jgi:hypothetical protein
MQKALCTLVLFLFLTCCSKTAGTEQIPAYVLDKEKFSDVIRDFTLAESAAITNIKNVPANKADSVYAFNPLSDNGIKRAQFDSSLNFYSHHPALFKEVYQLALEKLSKMQAARK